MITGSSGLLGSEILLLSGGKRLFRENGKVEISEEGGTLIHCAARVGGVKANTEFVADFYDENVRLNMDIMEKCRLKRIKLVSILSTCVYPDAPYVSYPLTEEQLHMGPPHSSNFGYAYAKRMLDVQSRAYRQQHGCNFITVIPNNLYGINDNYDLELGHVVPALIRKFHEAKMRRDKEVIVWGSGRPVREFTFARDAAKIILWLVDHYDGPEPVNVGNTHQVSIFELASLISEIFEFEGKITFDASRPEGQYQKPSSNSKLRNLGWHDEYTPLRQGLTETILHFQKVYPLVRGVTI